jgi:peptidylprolyl isomerase
VATSRRRERELARRRFERRRQAELERRAKAKKRNNVIGAVLGTLVLVAALVGGGFWLFGGSNHKAKAAAIKPAATPAAVPTPTPTPTPAPPAPTKCAKITPDPTKAGQPKIPQVKGKLTTKLVIKDVKVGHGPAAKAGDTLGINYIGVSCDTGKVFDATYLHTPVAPFSVTPLGTAQVITGWNQGLVGIRQGGVRELIIPASLGYGPAGSGPTIPGNDTLVFLVTAASVKSG